MTSEECLWALKMKSRVLVKIQMCQFRMAQHQNLGELSSADRLIMVIDLHRLTQERLNKTIADCLKEKTSDNLDGSDV